MEPNYDAWLEPPDVKEPVIEDCECGGLDPDCEECNGLGEVELTECGDCGYIRCACDEMYESWKEREWE
jgi:hypothetical protein